MNASTQVQSYLPYAVIPAWLAGGAAHGLCHRRHDEAIP
jgi:hypothetical protein